MGARRELLKTGSISRLRASYQQLDSESDKEKQPPFATLGKEYPIRKRYVNLALASRFIDIAHHFIGYCFPDDFCEATT